MRNKFSRILSAILTSMSFSLVYLLHHFFFHIWEFVRDWYWRGYLRASDWTLAALERFDQTLALRITLRNFGKPMYGDRSVLGYLLGFIFRTFRIGIALLLYAILIATALLLYILWALVPLFAIYLGIKR